VQTTKESIDRTELEAKVKAVPGGGTESDRHVPLRDTYHSAMGPGLAKQLGYPARLLDAVPSGAVESFAGVGYFFDLASAASAD
jgi:arsenite methyltransferase